MVIFHPLASQICRSRGRLQLQGLRCFRPNGKLAATSFAWEDNASTECPRKLWKSLVCLHSFLRGTGVVGMIRRRIGRPNLHKIRSRTWENIKSQKFLLFLGKETAQVYWLRWSQQAQNMVKAPSVLGAKQPRDHGPCRSPCDPLDGEALEQEAKEAIVSVAISPSSRLYVRSFSHEALRRSVSSNTVLQCGGAALGNGNERFAGEELFDEKWDMFVSHNWSVKRWKKFLALCLVWSGKKAVVSCFLVQLILFVLVSLDLLPISQSLVDGHPVSVWCTAGCIITYLAVFLVAHDVLALLRIPGYRTFLDKVCVDQTDEAKKQEGIQSITAVLSHSETLVVLYSEVYLQRLWTVFELTAFLAVKPDGRLVVQPVILGQVAFFLFVTETFRTLEVFLMPMPSSWGQLTLTDHLPSVAIMALDFLGILICTIILRIWGRTRANMMQQICNFTFAGAKCQVEADRIEIMGAVKALARQESLVPADASTQQCAKSFEAMVKAKMPARMQNALSLTGIPLGIVLLMVQPSMAMVLDLSSVRISKLLAENSVADIVTWNVLVEILQDINYEMCMPIALGLVGLMSGSTKGGILYEAGCIFLCFLILVVGVWLPSTPMMPSLAMISSSPAAMLFLVSFLVVQALTIWGLYGSLLKGAIVAHLAGAWVAWGSQR